MNKILDKLGVYDLVAVLLSGIGISTFSILVLQLIYKVSINVNLQVNETLTFFVLSYFCGLVFQELGSLMEKKIIYKNNGLLKKALSTSNNSYIYLTQNEKKAVYLHVIEKLELNPNENNDNIVYNYCKFSIIESGDTSRIDKDQSLSAMSRSLSLYFTLLFIIILPSTLFQPSLLKIVLVIVSLALAVLFYRKYVKYAEMRYVYIFRTFYYRVMANV